MNIEISSIILATILFAVIGVQNAFAFDPTTGAHITVSNKQVVVTHAGLIGLSGTKKRVSPVKTHTLMAHTDMRMRRKKAYHIRK